MEVQAEYRGNIYSVDSIPTRRSIGAFVNTNNGGSRIPERFIFDCVMVHRISKALYVYFMDHRLNRREGIYGAFLHTTLIIYSVETRSGTTALDTDEKRARMRIINYG